LRRKLALAGVTTSDVLDLQPAGGTAAGTEGWQGQQVLGPVRCAVRTDPRAATLGAALAGLICPLGGVFAFTRDKLGTDVLAVDDTTLKALAETGTDIVARVQLEVETKSVATGPFYSENLPAETVLAAYLDGPDAELAMLGDLLDGAPLQLGGDETLGKGILWCRMHDAASATSALTGGVPA